jgi:hypothetical protein
MEKLLPFEEELKKLGKESGGLIIQSISSGLKSTPRGIESRRKDDESTTYQRGETLWYKDHPEAEPEILAFRGWAIWYYNEFIGDIVEEDVTYSIAYNSISEKILAYKIVSFEGRTLLENPADTAISKKYEELILRENLPERDLIDTTYNLYLRMKKTVEKLRKERESEKKPVGNSPRLYLKKATLWCIKNHSKTLLHQRPTLLLAYKRFEKIAREEKSDVTEGSFIKLVQKKWNDLVKEYDNQPIEFKTQNPRLKYYKSRLSTPRNNSKQKIKKDGKPFN